MDTTKSAVDGTTVAAPVGGVQANVTASPSLQDDLSAKFDALQAENKRIATERDNYRTGLLKAKGKIVEDIDTEDIDEKMTRIAQETLANSRLAEIAREQDDIIRKALKENNELKLALKNKGGTPPASVGIHSEGQTVSDTLVTPEQIAAFKAKGWDDKKIEDYKKNLRKKI